MGEATTVVSVYTLVYTCAYIVVINFLTREKELKSHYYYAIACVYALLSILYHPYALVQMINNNSGCSILHYEPLF